MATLLGVIVVIGYVTIGLLIKGSVLYIMWGWFLVPLGAPLINIPQAIGMSFVMHVLTNDSTAARAAKPSPLLIFSPLIVLGIAWIVKQFL